MAFEVIIKSVSGTRERKDSRIELWFYTSSVSELQLYTGNDLWVATLNISHNNGHKIVIGCVNYYKFDFHGNTLQ